MNDDETAIINLCADGLEANLAGDRRKVESTFREIARRAGILQKATNNRQEQGQ